MKKEILEKTKEKIYEMAIADVDKGKYSWEILNIIGVALGDIRTKEYEKEQLKNKAEKEKANKEYAEVLTKMLLK